MDYKQKQETEQFYQEFSKKVNDTVISLEMVNFQAEPATLNFLKLVKGGINDELWGLLVFCKHGLYFYVHPYESVMGMMFRQAARGKAPEEQLVVLHTLDELKFSIIKHKWYDLFSPYPVDRLMMEFKDTNGNHRTAFLMPHSHTEEVFDKISVILMEKRAE